MEERARDLNVSRRNVCHLPGVCVKMRKMTRATIFTCVSKTRLYVQGVPQSVGESTSINKNDRTIFFISRFDSLQV